MSDFIITLSTGLDLSLYDQAKVVISILFFFTFISSAFISNAAVAIILSPLAIILGEYYSGLDTTNLLDPKKAFLMAICFGASTSFMTPIGYQTNLMVFGPGQYRFKDFLVVGFPLTIIFWILGSYLIPIFWPII